MFLSVTDVVAPLIDASLQILGNGGIEEHAFVGHRMEETKGLGMKGLTGQQLKAVGHKLAILGKCGASQNLVATIVLVAKEWMTYVAEVGTNLMCASCLQMALYQGYVAQALEHIVVSHSMFAYVAIFGKNVHDLAVPHASANVAAYGAMVLLH